MFFICIRLDGECFFFIFIENVVGDWFIGVFRMDSFGGDNGSFCRKDGDGWIVSIRLKEFGRYF